MNSEPSRDVPSRYCDVVMKGGITSGVVYPLALVELSRAFRLKNIGGTSAGAIAAAAAAAAELGRGKTDAGFERLAQLPNELTQTSPATGRSQLFGFFQPQRATRSLFEIGIAALGGGFGAWVRVVLAAARALPVWFFGGALPGLWLGWHAWQAPTLGLRALGLAAALLVALAGAVVAAFIGVVLLAKTRLPAHHFGLCSGMPEPGTTPPQMPLTPWLANYLDEIAGRPCGQADPPLTFGHLWQLRPDSAERAINLEMMTTCLTHGRPYRLPLREDKLLNENRHFFFRADELSAFFPQRVVAWMIAHPRSLDDERPEERVRCEQIEARGFHRMPAPADLPVVVATRMSLSFPILLCAVPLHALDFSRTMPADGIRLPERCWFSDGGICSNFPVHFFDSPLPRWPTFGIDLVEAHPDNPVPVWMPRRNADGIRERWKRFDTRDGFGAVFGFLGAILNTAKDWTDNTQARLPGFRDRIAAVSLTASQGGLNLNMPKEVIEQLSNYGTAAGKEFVARFADETPPDDIDLTWQNHRRIRLRSLLAALEEMLARLENSIAHPVEPDEEKPYDTEVFANEASYRWKNQGQRDQAAALLENLRTLARQIAASDDSISLTEGAPKPYPELRMRSRA